MSRPLRLLLSLTTSLLAVTLLLYLTLGAQQDQKLEGASHVPKQSSVNALFSFTSPGSLFPPSAIISLTDDNSTFFLARPAAFGPLLPSDGLSGPLWIGSGFGDDALSRGELGCSDVPGWDSGSDALARARKPAAIARTRRTGPLAEKKDQPRASASEDQADAPPKDDGTDDHLHPTFDQSTRHPSEHADIQSLQESAEIAGKVVLLKRGGCGFLAKVEWAQRRGGVAVIVGDDVRGGALIRMYARGDTSNVTIPSLFTSHTTAHLLSSLLPSGRILSSNVAPSDSEASPQENKPTATDLVSPSSFTPSTSRQDGPLGSTKGYTTGKAWLHSLLSAIGLGSGQEQPTDNFKIGEDDWRDPKFRNLHTTTLPALLTSTPTLTASLVSSSGHKVETKYTVPSSESRAHWRGWPASNRRSFASISSANSQELDTLSGDARPHEGLWVTLTPTNVSSSPFFDTLLVLVVSPLVTLSVVYALLLLRSRIRRRRWRAPKSVVERLPVRTYQTISDSPSSPSATSEAATPTTPLLQRPSTQPTSSTARPISRDEPEAPATSSSAQHTARDREEEKRESGLAEWRRRYGGRQKECVVCLEEYVDGVSQVMSLPCGHEFHVDCITPWLVTRRRTCPICKGDVVRWLSQAYLDHTSPSSPTPRLADDGHVVDALQIQAAETRNDSPSASQPLAISSSAPSSYHIESDDDVEANWSSGERQPNAREIPGSRATEVSTSVRDLSSTVSTVIWRGFDAVRSSTGLQRRPPPEDVDRDR
ncbi:zinc ion binding [Ascochyta rabiei]|uniref:RING-type E3 ubiquitin transferase n=1 Tax=Didymella rabiei TaxID=5454 RepID=A0A162XRX2_DIDRA|nr:zinc ion binding [Ascochyta rabiei]